MTGMSPRGEPTFPDWRQAKPGERVRYIHRTGGSFDRTVIERTERYGTVVRPVRGRGGGTSYMVVDWDDIGFGVQRGRVVAPAYELERAE